MWYLVLVLIVADTQTWLAADLACCEDFIDHELCRPTTPLPMAPDPLTPDSASAHSLLSENWGRIGGT